MYELTEINKRVCGEAPFELYSLSPPVAIPILLVSPRLSRFPSRRALLSLRMLALPLYPTSIASHQSSESVSQYRPAKDIESFNKLLPPVVEFVEGSSSGTLLVAEGRYEPINGSPKPAASEVQYHFRFAISCRPMTLPRCQYLPKHLKQHTRIPSLRHCLLLLVKRVPLSSRAPSKRPGRRD